MVNDEIKLEKNFSIIPDEARIFFCITFFFRLNRLSYLTEVLVSSAGWGSSHVDCVIFTNTDDLNSLDVLNRLCSKFRRDNFTITISSHPEIASTPRSLPWCHKQIMRDSFSSDPQRYTHYIYTEDDIRITRENLTYFMFFWSRLKPYGLLPGLIRYEYNIHENNIFNPDQHGQQNIADKARVMAGGYEFLTLNVPYAGAFIIDYRDMEEYLASASANNEDSRKVIEWGEPERAAMGLTWEHIPTFFPCRVVVPLKPNTTMPSPMCWIHHLPDNYTNDILPGPNFILGKTRMDNIFGDLDQKLRAWRFVSCFSKQNETVNDIVSVGEVYEQNNYKRIMPILEGSPQFISSLKNHYIELNNTSNICEKSLLICIKKAYLIGPVLYAEIENKLSILLETYRPNDRPYVYAPLTDDIFLKKVIDSTIPDDSVSIFIGSAGSFNYGHWLTDDLPRLKSIIIIRGLNKNKHISIIIDSFGEEIDIIKSQSIYHYLKDFDNFSIKFIDSKNYYSFSNLYYVSPVSYHPIIKSPSAIDTLYSRIVPALPKKGARRLFVSRLLPHSRSLTNHTVIEERLAEIGFHTLVINGQNFDEQADAFASADVIVGCMGAAMTNIAFAQAGTQIVMLAPEGWMEPYYWDLATVRGLPYAAIYGKLDDPSESPVSAPYTIDPDHLIGLLNRLVIG